jgi:hypothetical protein
MEVYTFLATRWDVGKAHEMIEAGDILREGPLDLSGPVSLLGLHHVDKEYADKLTETDLERPVVLAVQDAPDDSGPFTMLIDGWHRVWKAHELGRDTLPAVMLDGEQLIVVGLGR